VADTVSSIISNWQEVAAALQCPTLLITGDPEKDAVVSPAIVAEAQLIIPKMRHINLAHAGHNIRRESFQPYLSAVSQFMDSLIAI
jgi:pimeloyl-ACP methyl ester carboxylesterase